MWHLKERAAHNLLDIFKLELIHFYTVSLVYGDIYLFFKDFILEAELHTHTHVQKDRDKEKKRVVSSVDSLPRWLYLPGLGQIQGRSQKLHPSLACGFPGGFNRELNWKQLGFVLMSVGDASIGGSPLTCRATVLATEASPSISPASPEHLQASPLPSQACLRCGSVLACSFPRCIWLAVVSPSHFR